MADNRDPREVKRKPEDPDSHPVGAGLGAVGGAAAGAAIGSAAGPVGTVVGGVAGGIAGGLAGHAIADMVNPTVEEEYWRTNFSTRPYASGQTYETYLPAYRYGWESYPRYAGRKFDEIEPELKRDWEKVKDSSRLSWEKAKDATRDAWHRIERAIPGDADKDGR